MEESISVLWILVVFFFFLHGMIYLQFRILPQYVGIVKHEDNILIRIEVPGEILYPSQTGQVKRL